MIISCDVGSARPTCATQLGGDLMASNIQQVWLFTICGYRRHDAETGKIWADNAAELPPPLPHPPPCFQLPLSFVSHPTITEDALVWFPSSASLFKGAQAVLKLTSRESSFFFRAASSLLRLVFISLRRCSASKRGKPFRLQPERFEHSAYSCCSMSVGVCTRVCVWQKS